MPGQSGLHPSHAISSRRYTDMKNILWSMNFMDCLFYQWLIQTLLFMKAFKHWISLCWFLLSILSCLKQKKHRKANFDYMIIPWNEKKITHRWDIIGDHSLFLVQKLLQSIQEKTKTLMTKVINPTRKKTQTNIEISYVTFIQNCYCSAGLL